MNCYDDYLPFAFEMAKYKTKSMEYLHQTYIFVKQKTDSLLGLIYSLTFFYYKPA